jgi:hypothetical protein
MRVSSPYSSERPPFSSHSGLTQLPNLFEETWNHLGKIAENKMERALRIFNKINSQKLNF